MTPYWLEEQSPAFAPPPARQSVDVGIVGAGITGCACALALAEAGVRVRLVDERRVAEGASGRNGGFALRGTAAPYDAVVADMGRERALALWQWTESELRALEELGGDAFRQVGSLRLAADGEEREDLRDELEALWADGLDAEWIDEPGGVLAGRFTAAIRHPTDAALQPARLVRRLAERARRAGAEIVEGQRVTELSELDAETVVIATDGYPSGLLGQLEGLIVPTRGQVIATEPLAERLFDVPHYGRHGFDYWHQAEDGRLVAGGFRDVSLDQRVHRRGGGDRRRSRGALDVRQRARRARAARRLPLGRDLRSRAGLPARRRPGPGLERVWVAGGYSGHGNVLGFACGRLVARALLGDRDPLLDLFEPARLLG